MDRRRFLSLAAVGAPAAVIAPELGVMERLRTYLRSFVPNDNPPATFGHWEIAVDGTMSLHGQTDFNVYGPDGGLSFSTVSYKWVGGRHDGEIIEIKRSPRWGETIYSKRTVWTVTGGGTLAS